MAAPPLSEAWRGGWMLSHHDLDRIVFGCGNFGGIGSSPELAQRRRQRRAGPALARSCAAASAFGGSTPPTPMAAERARTSSANGFASQGAAFRPGRPDRDQGRQSARLPARRDAAQPAQIAWHLDRVAAPPGGRADRPLLHPRVRPRDAARRDARGDDAGRRGRQDRPLRRLQRVAVRREGGRSLAGASLAASFEYVQNEYNLLAAADAEALIPYCAGRGLRYTAFSPLAGGFLTGKYRFGEQPPPGSRFAHAPEVCAAYSNEGSFAAIERLRQSAEARRQTMARPPCASCSTRPGSTA